MLANYAKTPWSTHADDAWSMMSSSKLWEWCVDGLDAESRKNKLEQTLLVVRSWLVFGNVA